MMNCAYSKTKTAIRKNNNKQEKNKNKDMIVLSNSREINATENKNTKTFEYGLTFPCNTSPNLFLNNLKFRLEHYGCIQGLNSDDFVL